MELQIPARPPSARAARSAVSRVGVVASLPSALREDVFLVVSELVSNGVSAAPAHTAITVAVDLVPGCLTVEVRNTVRDVVRFPDRPAMPPPTSPNGRGLALVHRLATAVFTSTEHGVLTVTAVFRLDLERDVAMSQRATA